AAEQDSRTVTALAVLPDADQGLLRSAWGPDVHQRLRDLGDRYSLLAAGDLHPTVREALRRYWRNPAVRPPFFGEVLSALEAAVAALPVPVGDSAPERFVRLGHELNLAAWREGGAVLPRLSRAICLSNAYGVEQQRFVSLLAELPLPANAPSDTRALWQTAPGTVEDD